MREWMGEVGIRDLLCEKDKAGEILSEGMHTAH